MPHHPVHPLPVVRPVPLPADGVFAFNDHFDGPAGTPPDPANWAYDLGPGAIVGGNHETETYTDVNAYQDGNSHLVIAVTANSAGGTDSARVKTLGRFTQLYGSWQASIAIENVPGCWPAFWFLGVNRGWPACGEADVMENYGTGFTEGTVWNSTAAHSITKRALTSIDQHFHTYQIDVAPGKVSYFADGTCYLQATADTVRPWPFDLNGGLYAILNIAVNGTGTGGITPEPSALPARMRVDFVRAWTTP